VGKCKNSGGLVGKSENSGGLAGKCENSGGLVLNCGFYLKLIPMLTKDSQSS
jgi:hypothetical protein